MLMKKIFISIIVLISFICSCKKKEDAPDDYLVTAIAAGDTTMVTNNIASTLESTGDAFIVSYSKDGTKTLSLSIITYREGRNNYIINNRVLGGNTKTNRAYYRDGNVVSYALTGQIDVKEFTPTYLSGTYLLEGSMLVVRGTFKVPRPR